MAHSIDGILLSPHLLPQPTPRCCLPPPCPPALSRLLRLQLRVMGQDAARVRRIFVTHMHGDHCFGVGGVIAAVNEVS